MSAAAIDITAELARRRRQAIHDRRHREAKRLRCQRWRRAHPLRAAAVRDRWRRDNPVAYRAHWAVAAAIRSGVLVKPERCEQCGKAKRLSAHHWNYELPLDCEWLCAIDHATRPKGINGTTRGLTVTPGRGVVEVLTAEELAA
jgi:hypothetical protein